jgi:hypothetical protein
MTLLTLVVPVSLLIVATYATTELFGYLAERIMKR